MRLQGPDRELLWKLTDGWPPAALPADTLDDPAVAASTGQGSGRGRRRQNAGNPGGLRPSRADRASRTAVDRMTRIVRIAMSAPEFPALRALIHQPHVAPLTEYARKLRRLGKGYVPNFDPQDGGIHARILFLFEKPSRETEKTGFITRDSNDSTA